MTKSLAIAGLLAVTTLAGCVNSPQAGAGLSAAGGAAAGVIAANLFDANPEWTLAAGLAGAATGAAIYQNQNTGQCAYPLNDGSGNYRVGPCR